MRDDATRKPTYWSTILGTKIEKWMASCALLHTVAAPKRAQRRRIYQYRVPDLGYQQKSVGRSVYIGNLH
jgi:hypothetical protein